MSLRFVFAALSATLAPIGAEAELVGIDLRAVAEGEVAGGQWVTRSLGPDPNVDGPPARLLDWRAAPPRVPSGPRRMRPSGRAPLGMICRSHFTQCGYTSGRLDLPPPPLG